MVRLSPEQLTYTQDQLRDLQILAGQQMQALEQAAQTDEARLKTTIAASVKALDTLIGPDNPAGKSAKSLTEAALFTAPELAGATGIAHKAELEWMLTLAKTVRDIARVVSNTI